MSAPWITDRAVLQALDSCCWANSDDFAGTDDPRGDGWAWASDVAEALGWLDGRAAAGPLRALRSAGLVEVRAEGHPPYRWLWGLTEAGAELVAALDRGDAQDVSA